MCVCVGHAGQTDPQATGKHPAASDNKSPADYFFFCSVYMYICRCTVSTGWSLFRLVHLYRRAILKVDLVSKTVGYPWCRECQRKGLSQPLRHIVAALRHSRQTFYWYVSVSSHWGFVKIFKVISSVFNAAKNVMWVKHSELHQSLSEIVWNFSSFFNKQQ